MDLFNMLPSRAELCNRKWVIVWLCLFLLYASFTLLFHYLLLFCALQDGAKVVDSQIRGKAASTLSQNSWINLGDFGGKITAYFIIRRMVSGA